MAQASCQRQEGALYSSYAVHDAPGVARTCMDEPKETLCWALRAEVGCTCGIVCACMQEHHIVWLALAEVLQEALLVQAPCRRLVVAVLLLLHLGIPPDAAEHRRDLVSACILVGRVTEVRKLTMPLQACGSSTAAVLTVQGHVHVGDHTAALLGQAYLVTSPSLP